MARVQGDLTIGRPVESVFDFVADQTNEPQYNAAMVRAEKETRGPIGKRTKFRSAVRSGRRAVDMVIEFTDYDRPRLLASHTTMKQAEIDYVLTFEPTSAGTHMRWSGNVHPKGALHLLTPAIGWIGARQERRIWEGMKRCLEGDSEPTGRLVDGE
jgi:uncharacterized protein YndB with AHSA1/START domain